MSDYQCSSILLEETHDSRYPQGWLYAIRNL